ncbi:MAG: hypothetical protein U9N42_04630 [Campylobacterota bacterium]|nr:hypothetical protein [Campylobacterota bacterium]
MFQGLSLDQAPPYEGVIKFFLSAPIFALLYGILLLISDPLQLHSNTTIAFTHLFTIGFMVITMFGALQQMLPVVAGAPIPSALKVSNITFYSLLIALAFFVIGFYMYNTILLTVSAVALTFSLLYFSFTLLHVLLKIEDKNYIIRAIIASLSFFVVGVFVGLFLLFAHISGSFVESHYVIASMHYVFMFFGWVALLIIGISFQVVPMFWVADAYKLHEQKYLLISVVSLLVLYPVFALFEMVDIYKFLLSPMLFYALYLTALKLHKRKRKITDYSVKFWFVGIISLAIGLIYWILMSYFELNAQGLGLFFGFGFTLSIMSAMLYKIVPFLTWFHLNSKGYFEIPTMRDMLNQKLLKAHFYLHVITLSLFSLALYESSIIKIATVVFIMANAIFCYNLFKSALIYKQTVKE